MPVGSTEKIDDKRVIRSAFFLIGLSLGGLSFYQGNPIEELFTNATMQPSINNARFDKNIDE